MSEEPLRMYRGDTQRLTVMVTDRDTGDPVDIGTMDLRFTAKYSTGDTDDEAVIVKTSDYGGITLGDDIGEAIISIEPEDTEDLTKTTTLLWDFQATDGLGAVRTAAPLPGSVRAKLIIYADVSITAP